MAFRMTFPGAAGASLFGSNHGPGRSRGLRRSLLVILAGLGLSACATRGALDFRCDGFRTFVEPVQAPRIVQEIQSDAVSTIDLTAPLPAPELASQGGHALDGRSAPTLFDALRSATGGGPAGFLPSPGGTPPVLLLSGGGQWGAFGAGFLTTLHQRHQLPDFGVITGISTGGMQSLFVAIAPVQHVPGTPDSYDALIANYSPKAESEVVDRHRTQAMAALTGSLAGLKPLRRRVEKALCTNGDPELGCPMIERLAQSRRQVFVGFVKADSGQLEYANGIAIAGSAAGGVAARRNAQQCLAGIALASAAMPVFFQQVRINGETYYDGGVRQSVFEANVAQTLDAAVAAVRRDAQQAAAKAHRAAPAVVTPAIYVVRNGPTQLLGPDGRPGSLDEKIDTKADALSGAFRAEAIVVNQLEVGSIASLRIAHPTGALKLVTADGFNAFPWPASGDPAARGCPKPRGVMFDPGFMLCLQHFGRSKAERAEPWIAISPLDLNRAARRTGNSDEWEAK